ncbi:MAG: murein biosynthesis integral membrane protein MurJ [Anaerolineae bacterium]
MTDLSHTTSELPSAERDVSTGSQNDPLAAQAATADAQAEAQAAAQAATNAGVARATGVLALGNISSRVLGLTREIAMTSLFGASRAVDAFNYATLIPVTLNDLLIGGHVNSAIIPVLSEVITREGKEAFWRLASVLFSFVMVIVSAIALLLALLSPQVVGLISSGADIQTQQLAAELLRWVAPALVFLALFAVAAGALYALRKFSLPAFAGTVFNAGVVLGTVLLAPPPQITPVLQHGWITLVAARPASGVRAAAFGWLIGALAQLALQLPGLIGGENGLRFTLNWRHPGIRRIALLYTPVLGSLLLDTFVRTFSYNLASQTGVGSVSYMNWATTLIQFPQGLVATAISIAILPTLARQAVLRDQEGEKSFKDTLGLGMRLSITLIIPAAIGLFVLAVPIIRVLFERGAFTEANTQITAMALRLYLIGLPFAAVDLQLVYAFYARQDTLTPAVIGFTSLIVYTIVAVMMLPRFGLFSLMIADSTKHITHSTLSAIILMRRMHGFGSQKLIRTIAKALSAALVMGALALIVLPILERLIGVDGLLHQALVLAIVGGLSLAVYATGATLLRIQEFSWILRMIRSRVGL